MQSIIEKFGKKSDRKLTNLTQGDLWAESPMFQPSEEEFESEHIIPWIAGQTLAGKVMGLRRTKNEVEKKRRDYAVFITEEGERFRAYTPGQLKYNLSNIPLGTYVEMTYNGKKETKELGEVHDFTVQADVPQN